MIDASTNRYCLHCLKRPSAGENRQSLEKDLLVTREQVVAPADRLFQSLLAARRGRVLGREKPEVGDQPFADLFYVEHAHPAGGELDSKGKAVQAAAQLRDRGCVTRGDGKTLLNGMRTFRKQHRCLAFGNLFRCCSSIGSR